MDVSKSELDLGGGESKFRPVFSTRIHSQLINQGKIEQEEGNTGSFQKKTVNEHVSVVNRKHGSVSSESEDTSLQLESFTSIPFMADHDCWLFDVHTVTKSSPSPSISGIHPVPLVSEVLRITGADSNSSCDNLAAYKTKDVHISAQLMEDFLELGRDNTDKNLETCGLLGAFLEEETFYVTTLIIPKQESTSNSCQAINEEEIFGILNEKSLFPVGWVHTHPTQSCFMSSIDLHTQYSYQVMVPEAIAIVIAPTDKSRGYGIFRICNPIGMRILKECGESGFHSHGESDDGSSTIYEHCTNVYGNPNLRLEICDLR